MGGNEKIIKFFSSKIGFYICSGIFLVAAFLRIIFYITNAGDDFYFYQLILLVSIFVFDALSVAAFATKNKNMLIVTMTGFLVSALTFSATYLDYFGLDVVNDIFSIVYFVTFIGSFVCHCYLLSVSKPHPVMIKVFQGCALGYVVITIAWDIFWIILFNNNYETLDTILSGVTCLTIVYQLVAFQLRVNTYRIKREESKE